MASEVELLRSDLDDLESGLSTSDLESRLETVEQQFTDLCDELLLSAIEPLNDIYYSAC